MTPTDCRAIIFCVHVCVWVCAHACTRVMLCCACMHACVRACMCVYLLHASVYVCVHVYSCVHYIRTYATWFALHGSDSCLCMCVRACVCVCVCVHHYMCVLHAPNLLCAPWIRIHIFTLIVVCRPSHMTCCLYQYFRSPCCCHLKVMKSLHLLWWECLQNRTTVTR